MGTDMGAFREKSTWGGGEWRTWVVLTFWLTTVVLFVVLVFVGGRTVGHTLGKSECAAQSRYFPDHNVVFVDVNYVSWDCLVETDSGIFIETKDFRATVEGD